MKNIGIFISSTFKDMDAERDLVVSVLKPAIESALNDRHVNARVQIVDLRWGVNTQDIPEDEREDRVLSECLDYIRGSRPFFIGFVGDRYGWVPPQKRWNDIVDSMTDIEKSKMGGDVSDVRSVTELEMLFGVLNDEDVIPSSFFFLRKPDVYEKMDPASRAVFCDSDPASVSKLEKLRKKIRDTYSQSGYTKNVIDYDCTWNGTSLVIDDKAITAIVEPLVRTVMSEIDIDEAEHTDLDDIIRSDISLIDERNSYYVPDSELIDRITSSLGPSSKTIVVKSEDGMGKTSLIAHLYRIFSDSPQWIPLVHFASKAGASSLCDVMLKKFLWSLPEESIVKLPLIADVHPGLLIRYLLYSSGVLDKRILLLIDNLQYLKDLEPVMAWLEGTDRISVIVTSNVDIEFLQDGKNAQYLKLPGQDEQSTRKMANLFMEASHKGLPSKVLETLLGKTTDKGTPAYLCPLWTILTLNHLVCLDLSDFAKMRSIEDVSDAEKITVYLQKIIENTPSEADLLPAYLAESFESGEEVRLANVMLEEGKSGLISLERLEKGHSTSIPLLTFQKVKKTFSPLFIDDYHENVVKVDTDILLQKTVGSLGVMPSKQEQLVEYLVHRSKRLAQVMAILYRHGTDDAFETIKGEFNLIAALFPEQDRKSLFQFGQANRWPELSAIFETQDPVQNLSVCIDRYHGSQSDDDCLLLCVSYWNLVSKVVTLVDQNENDGQKYSQFISLLESAFDAIRWVERRSLIALLADGLYFDARSGFEKWFRGNMAGYIHFKSMQEQIARILYRNFPGSDVLARNYASRLDENSSSGYENGINAEQQKRYMELGLKKSTESVRLFQALADKDQADSVLLDLYMAKVRRTILLSDFDNDAALDWVTGIIEEMKPLLSVPGIARQLAIAYDYCSRCLFTKGLVDDAIVSITEAVEILRKVYTEQPDSLEIIHSMATILKYRADMLISKHALTKKDVDELENYALLSLEKNHEDFVATKLLMAALVLDLYWCSQNNVTEGLYDLSKMTLQLVAKVLLSSNNIRILETKYFIPAMNFVFGNMSSAQRNEIVNMYTAIRTELINRRIATPELLPTISGT